MGPHLVHQFLGSNSDAVSQLLVREVILAEQVEVLPGNRVPWATASESGRFRGSGCFLDLLAFKAESRVPAPEGVLPLLVEHSGSYLQ